MGLCAMNLGDKISELVLIPYTRSIFSHGRVVVVNVHYTINLLSFITEYHCIKWCSELMKYEASISGS